MLKHEYINMNYKSFSYSMQIMMDII